MAWDWVDIKVPPGVLKTRSNEGAAGRWIDTLNVRFVGGKPRKKNGFERINATDLLGKARGMEAWNTILGGKIFEVGTNLKLYGSTDGEDVIDITPLRFPQSWVNQLAVTIDLGAVTVTQTAHGYSLGQQFTIYGASFAGGSPLGTLLLNGVWEIVKVVDANHFKIYPATAKGALGANPFAMVNLSTTVTVTHTAHGRATGDGVWFDSATAAGGITIDGDYKITVVNANSYTIVHAAAATSTVSGGGNPNYHYGSTSGSSSSGADIVPYLVKLTNPFTTVNGSNLVTVAATAHGAHAGDTVHISGATAVGGLTLAGAYTVTTVVGANSYKITAAGNASSAATGGGTAVLIEYELTIGYADKASAVLRGFGRGPLGAGFFGRSGPANDATYFDPRTWSISKVGEDSVASPLGGSIYYWDSSVAGRADRLPAAPDKLRYCCMTEERHLHALGVDGDPMVFGWASQDLIDDWVATPTNTANEARRVREGSALVAMCVAGSGMNLIWTDTACYEHQYTGGTFIYDTRLSMSNCGLVAAQGFARTPKGIIWMGINSFFIWNGAVQSLPNQEDVQSWVFDNLDPDQKPKAAALYDPINNCVDFHYPPKSGAEPSVVVTVNLNDWTWFNDTQTRTTGAFFDAGAKNPLRVNGPAIYKHEIGKDGDGVAAASRLTLAPYEVGKGHSEMRGFDPDFKTQVGSVDITLTTYDRTPGNTLETETETVAVGDELADFHIEGRHLSLELAQTELGGDWSLDTPQIEIRPGARRR